MPTHTGGARRPPSGGGTSGAGGRAEQAARRQIVFREVNESIAELTSLASDTGYCLFICECSDVSCVESLQATLAEYDAVRSDPTRFLVVPGHQQEAVEHVVDGNGRFLVVEMLGRAAAIAAADDPRRT